MAQQDKIIGYFLNESQEHLRVIEEGLVTPNLLSQPAHIKEVFRAAHSIKGGAAMLELDTIQQIGHHFEQAFKQIKEKSLSVDEPLQNLLLEGLEMLRLALQILRHQQTPPISLAQEEVFGKIRSYLASQGTASTPSLDSADLLPNPAIEKAFSSYVNYNLRQFDELSSKPRADNNIRQDLSDICQKIGDLGRDFDFVTWTNLLTSCQIVINNPLIPIDQICDTIPNAIKQAQFLVINGNHQSIVATPELNELLMPKAFTDLTLTSSDSNFDISESGFWSDETSLDGETKVNIFSPDLNKDDDSIANSTLDPLNRQTSLEETADIYNVGEFMQLFEEEITADGTWVQEEDVLALDNIDKSAHSEENRPSNTLWDEDIFERPLPLLTLDEPNSNLAYNVELQPTVNLPQFNFEEPSNSELFMEDEAKTDSPAINLNTAAINSLNGKDIDWSGLLADIPDEAIVDYQELVTSSSTVNNWPIHPIGNSLNPAVSGAIAHNQPDDSFDIISAEEEKLFSTKEKEKISNELAAFDLEQPVFTDFAVENGLSQKDSSILDTDNFHKFSVEKPINQDQDNLILDVFEFDDDQFTFDFLSQPSTDLEVSNIFSIDPPPIVSTPDLPTLDELMAKSLNTTSLKSEVTSSDLEDWRELSVFDDLLADTQTTDADITDLNQIMINGNLDPELELEDLGDLSDFLQASVSSDQIGTLDSLVKPN